MVKSGLIFVILVIGYFDANRVLARVPNDVEVFSETLMSLEDELLPSKVEEGYQNDEPIGQEEGSGIAPQEEVGGEYVPDQPVEEDAISKEKDHQSAADEYNNQDNDDVEEDLNVDPITEEEPSKDVETADGNGEIADEADTSTQVEKSEDEKTIDERLDKEEDTSKMQEQQTQSSEYDVKTAEVNAEDDNSKTQEASEQQAEPLEYDDKTAEVNTKTSDEENDTSKTQEAPTDEIALDPIVEEGIEQSQPISDAEDSVKPDTIEETITNEPENIRDNKEVVEVFGSGELEHQELEPEVVHEDNKEEHTLNRLVKTKFPNEQDLPAERMPGRVRGIASMPMQEEAKRDGEEVEKEVKTAEGADLPVEQRGVDGEEDEKKIETGTVDNGEIEEQKEMEDSGASSASSGSNAVTFVVILGIVCVVGIVGFFIHKKRRRTQRATTVPTHEDRELKEVKTHRSSESDDDGAAKKQASSHIPEANPLILTNSHFKRNVDMGAQEQQQNGHLPTDQQQQALLTTLLATTKQQKDADDIRMMDEDAEEEGAERRPLVMSSFKPNIQISGAIAINVGAKVELGKDSDAATGEDQ